MYPLLDDEEAARRRLADAFAIDVDGIGLDELVGGCGVAESVLTALDRAGLRVVAVADVKGTVANPAGLDVEALLAARGITVLPDVVVNSGTNAWWWWTLFGDIGADADEAFAHTRRSMRTLVDLVLTRAEAENRTPRAAAHALAADRLPVVAERFGSFRRPSR